jgi:hypothetical protein
MVSALKSTSNFFGGASLITSSLSQQLAERVTTQFKQQISQETLKRVLKGIGVGAVVIVGCFALYGCRSFYNSIRWTIETSISLGKLQTEMGPPITARLNLAIPIDSDQKLADWLTLRDGLMKPMGISDGHTLRAIVDEMDMDSLTDMFQLKKWTEDKKLTVQNLLDLGKQGYDFWDLRGLSDTALRALL